MPRPEAPNSLVLESKHQKRFQSYIQKFNGNTVLKQINKMQKSTQDPDEKVDEVLSNLKGNIKAWSKKTETLEKKKH